MFVWDIQNLINLRPQALLATLGWELQAAFFHMPSVPKYCEFGHLRRDMRFPTMWSVRPAKAQTSLRIRAVCQSLCLSLEYSMSVKLLTEHHLDLLSLKGGCRGSSESTHVKIPHCWKSIVTAHLFLHTRSEFSIFLPI